MNEWMKKQNFLLVVSACFVALLFSSHKKEEGMFPLSHLNKIDFKNAGFNINREDIFNPNGISLTNALVRIGGCTGSFISEEGLIITNHHCVFGAVSNVSSVENNYLEHGFLASDREKEIPVGIECKITRSYEDVSDKVLQGVLDLQDGKARETKIAENIKLLTKEESAKYPDLSIEISEMFLGRSYVLFRYEILKDTRLVYVPPRQVGEFGGETDNWEWPRHTGDFSIVRAYSNKENKAADFSKENVPYKPQKHLKINPKGVQENDLVFILGYPGRTFRHQPASYIEYQESYLLPYISEWAGFKINTMMNASRGKGDEARYLKFASDIKRLANVKKNYEGKMQGLSRTGLMDQKRNDDKLMHLHANATQMGPLHQAVIPKIDSIYAIKKSMFEKEYTLMFLLNDVKYYQTALTIYKSWHESFALPQEKRDSFWIAKQKTLLNLLEKQYLPENRDIEMLYFAELMKKLDKLGIAPKAYTKNKEKFIQKAFAAYEKDHKKWLEFARNDYKGFLSNYKSEMIQIGRHFNPHHLEILKLKTATDAGLNLYVPTYTDVKYRTKGGDFIPDANATLRLTYGYIKSYEPVNGEIHTPLTSVGGILEKYRTENPDYFLPDNLRLFFERKDFPEILLDKKTRKPVVCMLYNLDTTGGNSGSPVMDANGDLVGVNFDRTYTATINDFAWNENYSRSVAVDIRYVLYIMKYLSGADNVLAELNIKL